MNGPIDNETMKPLMDEQLGEVAGGFVAPPLPGGIGGRSGDPAQRGTGTAAFATLAKRSYRMCPKCGLSVSPADGKCPLCGALMGAGPAEFI